MYISRFLSFDIFSFRTQGLRSLDDFNIKSCAKRLHVRDCEIVRSSMFRGREKLVELCESESCQDGHNVCIVAEIEVD